MYSTVPDCVKLVLANKTDLESERAVTRAEGVAFARAHGCLFLEVSAKSRLGVQEAFAELVQRVRLGRLCSQPRDPATTRNHAPLTAACADCGVAVAAGGVHRCGRARAAAAEQRRPCLLLLLLVLTQGLRHARPRRRDRTATIATFG